MGLTAYYMLQMQSMKLCELMLPLIDFGVPSLLSPLSLTFAMEMVALATACWKAIYYLVALGFTLLGFVLFEVHSY